MKKWIFKAIVQKGISFLPYDYKINYLFQKHVTKGVFLSDDYFFDKLIHVKNHLEYYSKLKNNAIPVKCFELGTGWYPVIPVALFLTGAVEIVTTDITPLSDKQKFITTIEKFLELKKQNKAEFNYLFSDTNKVAILTEIIAQQAQLNFEQIQQKLHINYIKQDARKLDFASGYFDFIVSNNVFEHIYPHLLIDILKEFKRVWASGGVMSHFIDMSDHFAHLDKTINIYNFLQFTDNQWNRIDNSVQPQNRMRIDEYVALYNNLSISINIREDRPGNLTELKTIALSEKYKAMPIEMVAISHSYLASLNA
ncbi:MAG: class I SAM-dependent methyltransferase [Bacteroidia bacterium]